MQEREIAPQQASPAGGWRGAPGRARLAADGQQHMLACACVLALLAALVLQRLLLAGAL